MGAFAHLVAFDEARSGTEPEGLVQSRHLVNRQPLRKRDPACVHVSAREPLYYVRRSEGTIEAVLAGLELA